MSKIVTLRRYVPERDYMQIRELIIETFPLHGGPFNWLIERWNFCRFHVLPLHRYYSTSYFSVPTRPHIDHRDDLPLWQDSIGIWENEEGRIVAVAHSENEEPGEAWIQIHPAYKYLYPEIVDYIEENLADRANGIGFVKLYVNDGDELEKIAKSRGYVRQERCIPHLVYEIGESMATPSFPEGFRVLSVAEEDDPVKRSRAKAMAFSGYCPPSSWPPVDAFREMQMAPDYRKELDLFVVAPDGEYASFCTIWLDLKNGYGNFEPVGTHISYRKLGLATELLKEGFRRMKSFGIDRSFMNSTVGFYRRFGFKETSRYCRPWIKYFKIQ
ncbi:MULTISPECIES: GNAT family N-acetyltransferase [Mesotoga]|uniref:GNAT family N-acetyltransferase n=1 Tax=Mesotoga TaxID=1184396 RepID=UPI0002CA6DC9|nr:MULTISPECIES: GNAT family N-acetyltransferase [Mesotoga]MCP5460173.1 GNAT family N-acetyltransferase [Thermotogota bacterium]CCU84047.1 hypothetical protein PHOSAC3_120664 [Mesotoga infera]MDK2944239.1 hypothetical protein [Mesotoga sp.]RLL81897.1 hypothetical protein Y696_05030 [Mesotoga sp. H07pep.5.4]RLL92292.1 hypothetical protein BG32_12265 [Mesotoga sp. HF07.pep.5.2.highcov]